MSTLQIKVNDPSVAARALNASMPGVFDALVIGKDLIQISLANTKEEKLEKTALLLVDILTAFPPYNNPLMGEALAQTVQKGLKSAKILSERSGKEIEAIEAQAHGKFWDARNYANRNYSPIILDLNNDDIIGSTNVRKQHTNFDFDGKNPILEGSAWIDANDGFLVLDKNNNGKIDNGSELFGDNTLLSNGKIAKDGGYNNQINLPHTF